MEKYFLIIITSFFSVSYAQVVSSVKKSMTTPPGNGTVLGRVAYLVGNKKQPVEFASISVLRTKDSSLVAGTLANKKGIFIVEKLPPANYYIIVQAIGFGKTYTNNFLIGQDAEYKINEILMEQQGSTLKEVTVTAQKNFVEYKLDKRVYNIKHNLTSLGGTAIDALQNVPSLTVQSDGSMQLRGSEKILVLIDGKPSSLTGSDRQAVLNQMPASMIESIEVITTPSARYDAEASAGIINIITKRDKQAGFNSQASITAGTRDKYNSSISANWRAGRWNLLAGYDYIHDDRFVIRNADRETFGTGLRTFLTERENGNAYINSHNVKLATDFYLNKKTTLSGTVLFKSGSGQGVSENKSTLFNAGRSALNYYKLTPQRTEEETSKDITFGYRHLFAKKGQELIADFVYLSGNSLTLTDVGRQDFNAGFEDTDGPKIQWQNIATNNYYTLTAQTDYVHPTGKTGKLGLGIKFSNRNNDADFKFNDYAIAEKQYFLNRRRSNHFVFDEKVYAGYITYSSQQKKLNYNIGLRAEQTEQTGDQRSPLSPSFKSYNYFNLFPSALFNYQLTEKQRLNLGFTRRINRTAYGAINPFVSYLNPYNLLSGNADIKPELVNSVESGHLIFTPKGSFSTTVFYRFTRNQVARIRSLVDSLKDQNVTIMTIDNVDDRSSYGIEFIANQKLSKIWGVTANLSAFRTSISGNSQGVEINSALPSFVSRITNSFKFEKDIELQLSGVYRSPMPTTQGRTKYIYFFDLGAKKDVLKKRGSISLRVSDIFNTLEPRIEIRGTDFYMYNPLKQESRVLFLGFSYRFSQKFKATERRERKVVNEGRAGEGEP